ncbi:hypothetical protein NCAS_0C03210 [Naumovozyma castellii]|uniref:Structure-specific endonuclease subunit SLX4 n=1 Tax=Naumovozyma castellii TaxID=27288 RepID=G0VCV0_NAUCA|nr:hypothetical protein NCAS_0C03210 [Naumovozyma castellii CBS 4309]CCC69311.1 hypothetical protein NCAS_0C03210 [Naumovozyma castellii CBS 4309]
MDWKRAERNLKLLSELQDKDALNSPDMMAPALVGTQVPDMNMSSSSDESSDEKPTLPKETGTTENSTTNSILPGPELTPQIPNNQLGDNSLIRHNHTELTESIPNSQEIAEDVENRHIITKVTELPSDQIFLNTQLQSRLDEAEEESLLKSKLIHFKYSDHVEKTKVSPQKVTKRPSKRKSKTKNITQHSIEQFEKTRAQNLLKQLSGKHKKVRDIIRVQANTDKTTSQKRATTISSLEFDTYNECEWKYILGIVLQKFPDAKKHEMLDVFNYLYGDAIEVPSSESLWASSQLPPHMKSVDRHESKLSATSVNCLLADAGNENRSQMVNVLSLSQVMDDKSETSFHKYVCLSQDANVIDPIMSSDGDEHPIKENIIAINDDPVISSSEANENSDNELNIHVHEPMKDVEKDDVLIVSDSCDDVDVNDLIHLDYDPDFLKPCRDPPHTILFDSISVVSDSADEISGPIIPIDIPASSSSDSDMNDDNKMTINFPSQSPTPGTSPQQDEIIDLTQESFKAVGRLISPVRPPTLPPTEQTIQVPATRTSTILGTTNLENPSTIIANCGQTSGADQIRFIISKNELKQYEENCLEKQFQYNRDNIIVSDSEDEPLSGTENILLKVHANNNNGTISPMKSPMRKIQQSDIIESQSAQKLRESMKEIGLKPVRSKTEMIESLKAASRMTDNEEFEKINKASIFAHLTELIETDATLLERIYCFEAIPVDHLLKRLTELDPFIDHLDKMTIKEWADSQGICLRNG